MDAADPLCVVSSTTCLLRRTLGGPAPAASPSKADEALLRGISRALKGSKELIEQSKIAMKEYGDIRMVYQDDGGKATAAANCKNNQLGRRPAGERKRHRFTMKYPASKPLPVVDRSVLDTISDPDEYFTKEVQLDEAEAEIKRLNGEVQPTRTLNFEPVVERKRRNSSRPRKSYFFSSDAHAASSIITAVSQSENMAESQTSQDGAHASVSEKNEQPVPSRSDKCAISDSLVEEDSFNEKDKGDEITNIMASFQNYEGPDKLDYLRKTIGIGKIHMEKIYRHDSVLGDILPGSTAGINLQAVHTLEGPSSRTHQARVSELEKHTFTDVIMDKHKDLSKDDIFEGHTLERPSPGSHQARVSELAERIFRDAGMNKQTDLLRDDEFEGSPDIVMVEQSLAHDSSDVDLMTDETFSPREKYRMAPSPSTNSAEHVLDPEPNMPDCVTTDDNLCSRHNISVEEDNVPMDYSTIDKSNNEAIISSHHLEDVSTDVLCNKSGRDVTPDDIARTPHSSENYIQHQEVVEEDGVVQDILGHLYWTTGSITKEHYDENIFYSTDKSAHSSEAPIEDIGLQNRSQAPDGTSKKLTDDVRSALSPTKQKTQKAAQQGKTKQQPKRGEEVADESRHSREIPQADFDAEDQPHAHDVNTEKLILDWRNALSPTKEKKQKPAQRGKSKQQPKMGKKVSAESRHLLEIRQADLDPENRPHTHDLNTEQQTVMRNALSPNKPKGQKEGQRRIRDRELNKRKSLADAGLKWQSGVRRSTRIRHRPLEQWRGERFVYGRIHDTMVTVIGVKSYSPDQDGKRALKVKSFVPEQYSDVVTQGAKY